MYCSLQYVQGKLLDTRNRFINLGIVSLKDQHKTLTYAHISGLNKIYKKTQFNPTGPYLSDSFLILYSMVSFLHAKPVIDIPH